MAGYKLEIFKYGFYVFFPISMMLYLGDPSFIENHVVGEKFYPRLQDCNRPGKTKEEVEEQLKEARERFRRYKTNKNNESSGSDAL